MPSLLEIRSLTTGCEWRSLYHCVERHAEAEKAFVPRGIRYREHGRTEGVDHSKIC